MLPKTGAKTNILRRFYEAYSKSFSISFSRDYRKVLALVMLKLICVSFSQLLLKPVLKPWLLKLFRHFAKTSFSARFSQLLQKPVLKPWVLKLFQHDAKTSFSASFSQLLLKPVLKPWELKLFLIFRFPKDILASFSIKFCFINSFSSVAPAKVC